jgi:hypothetical protein
MSGQASVAAGSDRRINVEALHHVVHELGLTRHSLAIGEVVHRILRRCNVSFARFFDYPNRIAGSAVDLNQVHRNVVMRLRMDGPTARRLAEAGCSSKEIGAITGHRTLKEIERYTRAAAQRKLAGSAMRRLEMEFPNLGEGLGKGVENISVISALASGWRSRQGLNPQPPRSKRGTLSS